MAASASRVYVVSITRLSVTAAITLIQIKAGATVPLQIIRATLGQTTSNISTQQAVQINRKSGTATVTSFTPLLTGPATDPAAASVGGTAATGTNASAEGTDTDILRQGVLNYPMEWLYLPTPKEYLFVGAATFIGLKLPVAPSASTAFTADIVYEEVA